ncbi:enterochelin esterase-like enzyme [Pullulanibacillus pueri]|uniref:Enterochelin esterase n=1 Tax=Pullulanibacillus pueri TaxID=1437324 RepID=A0A8J3EMN7_9BACL|nr:alpha/beta hydrolase-fold protein [Pullulanibacillus pueri]MBM7680616.1 enterochelin esterase-like enzyme [Pullulanibacillus pueri]GGH83929.1 hypothetical protein GCM10007096_25830 [Pullulanibacillus pueri]
MPAQRTVEDFILTSRFLKTEVKSIIYLPPNYSPLYTYPLVIAQDGRDYFNLGRIAGLTDSLIEKKAIVSPVICAIPYADVKQRWHRYHPDGDQHEAFIKYLVFELLPQLKAKYALDDLASSRTLLGDSLGGTVSFITALRFPHTFGQVIMQSPYVNDKMLHQVATYPEAEKLAIYHTIGLKEDEVKTTWGDLADFLTPNRALHDALKQQGLASYEYKELEGNHTWKTWQADLGNALMAMLAREEA